LVLHQPFFFDSHRGVDSHRLGRQRRGSSLLFCKRSAQAPVENVGRAPGQGTGIYD